MLDIDECKKHDHPCGDAPDLAGHAESICTNTGGSYECDCPEGYAGDAYNGECKRKFLDIFLFLNVPSICKDGAFICVNKRLIAYTIFLLWNRGGIFVKLFKKL